MGRREPGLGVSWLSYSVSGAAGARCVQADVQEVFTMSSPSSHADLSAAPSAAQTFLSDEMLNRFAQRAPRYDRDNTFFAEDFDETPRWG